MKFPTLFLALFVSVSLPSLAPAVEGYTIWPATETPSSAYGKGNAFDFAAVKEVLYARFSDKENSDDYVHLDLGKISLGDYRSGGCVEIVATIDKPIARMDCAVASPSEFWQTRKFLEGQITLEEGSHTYRLYFNSLQEDAGGKDPHLYLFFQDIGGSKGSASLGNATIKITRIAVLPPIPGWQDEKRKAYAQQYHWPKIDKIEPLYAEKFDLGADWTRLSSSPLLNRTSLAGLWKKKFFGEKTWDTDFLADTHYAQPNYDDSSWEKVTVPEPQTLGQKGGHYWYRYNVTLSKESLRQKHYLRFDDLASDARIYVNGQWVGSQTSSEKQLTWITNNGSRWKGTKDASAKGLIQWQFFERCGIPSPFNLEDIPDGRDRLPLPLTYGEYPWPLAYDVTPFLREGENTISLRLYGNPLQAWWIFKHRTDRAAERIFGIFGDATLASYPQSGISRFSRIPPTEVNGDGIALHRFECIVSNTNSKMIASFRCGEQEKTVTAKEGKFAVDFQIPAQFADAQAQVSLYDGKGGIVDRQEIEFNTAVVDIKERQLRVNGEPYLIRGINANRGIEWNNDRTVTRREFLRLLRLYQQLGINTIRIQGIEPWQMEAALQQGIMVMPVSVAASTDWGVGIFGQLVSPDISVAVDRQRIVALQLCQWPNILLWNGGNELHHTPGYEDYPVIEEYLQKARQAFREIDPYCRPVVYANFDVWYEDDYWHFTEAQDVVGQNIYHKIDEFTKRVPSIIAMAKNMPMVFTEWGTSKGEKDRKGKVEQWEMDMQRRWNAIANTPGSIGGFLYAWHGELDDDRGRKFIQNLYLPYQIQKQGENFTFTNRSEAPMRQLSLELVSDSSVSSCEFFDILPPGETKALKFPVDASGIIEIRYDSHHGLKHFTTHSL